MESELKFVVLLVGLFIVGIFSAIIIGEHSKYTCRIDLAKTDRPAAEIELLCK